MKKLLLFVLLSVLNSVVAWANDQARCGNFVSFNQGANGYTIVNKGKVATIVVGDYEDEAVKIAAKALAEDFVRVAGVRANIASEKPSQGQAIVIATLGNKTLSKDIEKELKGKREKFVVTTADNSVVIAGSDRRGAVYGIYELSRQMGVSPWYWWADVPTTHREYVAICPGEYTDGEPAVEYRGIFINDEWPCFGNWTKEKFGGINSKMYEHLFELILRLKGNFFWPAMWASAFFDDDKQNGVLADKMGIVMSTSHHEPMQLNQQDWKRRGKGEWNYKTNSDNLKTFWRTGIERAKDWEKVVTIGMRGDGDTSMGEGTDVGLMERIVKDQREIIADVTSKPAEETPQVWALYKEVQDYYDQGMNVPDDVTLLLCDDNWGNVRRLPALDAKPRKGGYGMYYHADYVGAPRNSKWINITNNTRMWEQMRLTYEYNVRKIWIVNVGDLKLQEYPTQLFLDLAWSPMAMEANDVFTHTQNFYKEIFGEAYSQDIADIMTDLGQMNRAVIPEQLNAQTFSFNYNEWQRVVSKWISMQDKAKNIRKSINKDALDAYDQLVLTPIDACANLYKLYYANAKNIQLAKENNPEANAWADEMEARFEEDSLITARYHQINGGKWNHFMDQTHIGYKSWNEPKHNVMPKVKRVEKKNTEKIKYPSYQQFTASNSLHNNKYDAFEAAHTSRMVDGKNAKWLELPRFGKTLSGMTTWPQTITPDDEMALEYDFDAVNDGNAQVTLFFAPTLNFNDYRGLRYAISVNGGNERIVNINKNYRGELGEWQKNPVIPSRTILKVAKGKQTLRIRFLDPGMVLERVVINRGGVKPSYLGPTETIKQ